MKKTGMATNSGEFVKDLEEIELKDEEDEADCGAVRGTSKSMR